MDKMRTKPAHYGTDAVDDSRVEAGSLIQMPDLHLLSRQPFLQNPALRVAKIDRCHLEVPPIQMRYQVNCHSLCTATP
jgi:hypothetical protein